MLNCNSRFLFAKVSSNKLKFAKETAKNKGTKQSLVKYEIEMPKMAAREIFAAIFGIFSKSQQYPNKNGRLCQSVCQLLDPVSADV